MTNRYIPDIAERGERRAEGWAALNVRGDEFTCGCGTVCDLERGETLSPDPYAIPVCPLCFDRAMLEQYGPDWRIRVN